MSLSVVRGLLENYKADYQYKCAINKILSQKKIRHTNFPAEISENIVKFVVYARYGIMPTWDTSSGDLRLLDKTIEVKAFSTDAPTSFGPTEKWDMLLFLDATQFMNSSFRVYEYVGRNSSPQWQNLRVNKHEIFHDQCSQGRRPRLRFSCIKEQLGNNLRLIFDGHLDNLE